MSKITLKSFIAETKEDLDFTDSEKIIIAPGRFNPPHMGHGAMIDRMIALGIKLNATPVVIIVDSGKYGERNPLRGEDREIFLKEMFPGISTIIAKNPYAAVITLRDEGKIPIGGVCGRDRADSYKQMIGRIFGDSIKKQYIEEILERDPDSDDIAGMSASMVRQAVKDDNISKFRTMVDLPRDRITDLFILLKRGLNGE